MKPAKKLAIKITQEDYFGISDKQKEESIFEDDFITIELPDNRAILEKQFIQNLQDLHLSPSNTELFFGQLLNLAAIFLTQNQTELAKVSKIAQADPKDIIEGFLLKYLEGLDLTINQPIYKAGYQNYLKNLTSQKKQPEVSSTNISETTSKEEDKKEQFMASSTKQLTNHKTKKNQLQAKEKNNKTTSNHITPPDLPVQSKPSPRITPQKLIININDEAKFGIIESLNHAILYCNNCSSSHQERIKSIQSNATNYLNNFFNQINCPKPNFGNRLEDLEKITQFAQGLRNYHLEFVQLLSLEITAFNTLKDFLEGRSGEEGHLNFPPSHYQLDGNILIRALCKKEQEIIDQLSKIGNLEVAKKIPALKNELSGNKNEFLATCESRLKELNILSEYQNYTNKAKYGVFSFMKNQQQNSNHLF